MSIEPEEPAAGEPAPDCCIQQPSPRARLPWNVFIASELLYLAIKWTLDGIPPSTGEPLLQRWLRALVEHPVRSPLGLALAWLGACALTRGVLGRPPRS